jgi:putative ABC transport system substrate-binding protein
MRRREFITIVGGMATWPLAARAQQPSTKVFRIGFLGLPTANSLPKRPEAFRAGLSELGYREGRDFVIEYRWADGDYDRLPALLDDLIRIKVDVIVTHGRRASWRPNGPPPRSRSFVRSSGMLWRQVSYQVSRGLVGT